MSFYKVLKKIIPPFIIDFVKWIAMGCMFKSEWQYIPEGWDYAKNHPEVKGWNVSNVLEVYKKKWPMFEDMLKDSKPLGFVHESNLNSNENVYSHNVIMSFAYALTLASMSKDSISMLDWGGGIGHYYVLSKSLLPNVSIEYHCKDVPVLSEYGAKLFPQHKFYVDESCFNRKYDFVLASTSLHYKEDWQNLLKRLANSTNSYLYIANIPIVQKVPSFVFVQRPYKYGYNTEYLSWCLNRSEFLKKVSDNKLKLVREFVLGDKFSIKGVKEQIQYRGYLFKERE